MMGGTWGWVLGRCYGKWPVWVNSWVVRTQEGGGESLGTSPAGLRGGHRTGFRIEAGPVMESAVSELLTTLQAQAPQPQVILVPSGPTCSNWDSTACMMLGSCQDSI